MEEIVKHINDTNASFRTIGAGDAKNTDLFLGNEQYELFRDAGEQITVRFNKENLQKAILFIASILPRKYDNSAIHRTEPFSSAFVFDQLALLDAFFTIDGVKVESRTQTWNLRKDVIKKNGEIDNRFYFNGLLEDVSYINVKEEHKTAKFTIRNYLAGGYSDLHIKKTNNGIFDVWVTNTYEHKDDGKERQYEEVDITSTSNFLQQIFYGAPGTGKSNTIKREVDDLNKTNYRVTFHPDSDYSTFVGAYKPTRVKTQKQPRMDMSLDDLAKELGRYYNDEELGKIGGLQRFCFEYYPYIDGEYMSVNVTKLVELAGVPKDYNVEVNKYIKFIHLFPDLDPDKITYEFVPQAFTKAYTTAWNTTEDVYLIIEEINRGNCAQIFGDLFQLLDRKNGISEYPVDADSDLANHIRKELAKSKRTDFPEGVKDGKKLVLPSNLYIWATMNTSDQSLFPIDSAFKRRWEWKYIPIGYKNDKWTIAIGGKQYSWTDFQRNINDIIFDLDNSEDKMLGDFFVNADRTGNVISADTFLNKILFYLWNDVCKDEPERIFRWIDGKETKNLKFSDFFVADRDVKLQGLMEFLKVDDLDKKAKAKELKATAEAGVPTEPEETTEAAGEVMPDEE